MVESFEIHRLRVPTGRPVGGWSDAIESLDMVIVVVHASDGSAGWGFSSTVSTGRVDRDAWYVETPPGKEALEAEFRRSWWPVIEAGDAFVEHANERLATSSMWYLDHAASMAVWDVRAKILGVPLRQLVTGTETVRPVKAYGSLLDFPLEEDAACELASWYIEQGFSALKLKVGRDESRDIRRVTAIRETVGDEIEIAVDANEAWSYDEALSRIQSFERSQVGLAYVEDPMPNTEVESLVRLRSESPLPIVGHDHAPPDVLESIVERRAVDRVRLYGDDIHVTRRLAARANDGAIPLVFGNWTFSVGATIAPGYASTDRVEYCHFAYDSLAEGNVVFKDGFVVPSDAPGHGITVKADALREYAWNGAT